MKITDEMVEAAIGAGLDYARAQYPEIARWPDDFDEPEQQEKRAQMRVALTAAALAVQPDRYREGFEAAREMAADLLESVSSHAECFVLASTIRAMEMPK
jgi:hypothetical protein